MFRNSWLQPLAPKTAIMCLGMEMNWTWMTETDKSLHCDSSLCHTSSSVLTWEGLCAIHPPIPDKMFLVHNRSVDPWNSWVQGSNRIPCASGKSRTQSGLALPCWKIAFERHQWQGTATSRKVSETHWFVLKFYLLRSS